MVLKPKYTINLPHHEVGGFDHGDVLESNGFGFVAHTANRCVEMYDSIQGVHLKTIPGVPEASGVVCAQKEKLTIAASRGTGNILIIDATTGVVNREMQVGNKPNGIAWDPRHKRFLAADVGDSHLRIADPFTGKITADQLLPGKPRWCKYSEGINRFVVNLSDKATVAIIDPESAKVDSLIPVTVAGPHGVDVDEKNNIAYVACDGGAVIAVDLIEKKEIWKTSIPLNPDVAWLNVDRDLFYCAVSKPGLIEVINIEKQGVVEEVPTEEGCHTFAFHQKEQTLQAYFNRSCKLAVYIQK